MEERLPARSRNWREWCREVSLIRDTKSIALNQACWDALEKEIEVTKHHGKTYKGEPYTSSWADQNNQLDIIHYKFDGLLVYLVDKDNKPVLKVNPIRPYSWDHKLQENSEISDKEIACEMLNTEINEQWLKPVPKGRDFNAAFVSEFNSILNANKLCTKGGLIHNPKLRKWYQLRAPKWACGKCNKPMKLVPTFEQI